MLILASNSPRRRQLLRLGGWDFLISPAEVDEQSIPGESPAEYVSRLAEKKTQAALCHLGSQKPQGDLVVGADTAVVIPHSDENDSRNAGFEILGKPSDAHDAEYMLRRLRGRTHQVCTAIAVYRPLDGRLQSAIQVTEVSMRHYSDSEIQAYISSGDPMDKAGAYAIQHAAFQPVQEVKGCYANVMGLPVCRLRRLLAELDVYPGIEFTDGCEENSTNPCQIFRQALLADPEGHS